MLDFAPRIVLSLLQQTTKTQSKMTTTTSSSTLIRRTPGYEVHRLPGDGKQRVVTICIFSDTERDTVEYFIDKFNRKMAGSLPSTAAYWIDGIGECSREMKQAIWEQVINNCDTESRDRQKENGDMPEWTDLSAYVN